MPLDPPPGPAETEAAPGVATAEPASQSAGEGERALPPPLDHPDPTNSLYMEIEDVVAHATPDDLGGIFEDLRLKLERIQGGRVEHAKKVRRALDRTEELFARLLQVREQMAQNALSDPKSATKKTPVR